jgi:transcriptional regulator with XRE-family HTH domain
MPPRRRPKPTRHRTYLREWREFRNLTQQQAAERLEIEQSTLSRLERGESPYSQDFLERAAHVYMCEPADLLTRNPLDEDTIGRIAGSLRGASISEQLQAAAVIDALLKKTH